MLWLIAWPYVFLILFVTTWSLPAGVVLLAISGLGASVLIVRSRSGSKQTRFSTTCEECNAELSMHFGMSAATCPACGHVQSWSTK
jgi:predicted RNA-binding Zn-ribbon protein involved in translation (DUF1610 family)